MSFSNCKRDKYIWLIILLYNTYIDRIISQFKWKFLTNIFVSGYDWENLAAVKAFLNAVHHGLEGAEDVVVDDCGEPDHHHNQGCRWSCAVRVQWLLLWFVLWRL